MPKHKKTMYSKAIWVLKDTPSQDKEKVHVHVKLSLNKALKSLIQT